MAQILKQSTAVDVLIGPFLDKTDAATAETGESPSVKLSKNGQTLAAKSDVTTPVSDADGYYNCELDATDTGTVGTLVLTVAASATALPVRHEYQVVEEAVYDASYAASAAGPLQSTVAGRTLDVSAGGEAGIDWANVGSPTTAVDLSATDIQLVDTCTTNTDMLTAAAVNAEVDTALVDIKLDHLIAVADVDEPVNNSIVAKLADSGATADWSNYDNQTMSLREADVQLGQIRSDTGAILLDTGSTGVLIAAAQTVATVTGNVDGSVGSVTGAVGSVTGAVGSVTGAVGSVTGAVASVTGAVGSVAGNVDGNVTGSVGSLAAQAKADVNAEAVDVLATDTYAEPSQGAPGATISLASKISFLYKAWRNRSTQTATTYSLYGDDASTVDHKATVSDDTTTADKGEVGTGP